MSDKRGVRVSDVIKPKPLPKIKINNGPPIRASELVKRRHAKAVADFQRAIDQRENAFIKLTRIHAKIWKLGRQVQRYENGHK